MFRYVAFAWSSGDPAAKRTAHGLSSRLNASSHSWAIRLQAEGLLVHTADEQPNGNCSVDLTAQQGVFARQGVAVGTLFPRTRGIAAKALTAFDSQSANAIAESRGRYLIDHYWGRYVAFIRARSGDTLWVLRDPAGALPCFITYHARLLIAFSFAADIEMLGVLPCTINWNFVAAHACRPRTLLGSATGLEGVQEIPQGECWEMKLEGQPNKHRIKHLYWNPVSIIRDERIEDLNEAITELRGAVEACVSSWASCYSSILHLLSGGLDSSIVLSCLSTPSRHSSRITALTYYNTLSTHADEREYARLAAERCACQLVELEESIEQADLSNVLNAAPSVRPWLTQYYQTHTALEEGAAAACNASAVFSGSGGDHIFFQGPLQYCATDFAREQGLNGALAKLCADVARNTGSSFWSVLSECISNGWLPRRWNPEKNARKVHLTTSKALEAALSSGLLQHPWLSDPAGIPPGKLEHIRLASVPHEFYTPFGRQNAPEQVAPLISQPIVEICLRTPLYILSFEGCDRFVARRAFCHLLPEQIAWRRTKGLVDVFLQHVFVHNLKFIRELMLDGILVRENILDRQKTENVLSNVNAAVKSDGLEILALHLGTEAWLRRATSTSTTVSSG